MFPFILSLFNYPTFLLLWPGAGPCSMGGASSTIGNAYSTYYNPSTLPFISYQEIHFTHAHLLPKGKQGSFLEFWSFHTPINRWWHFGLYGLFFLRGKTYIFRTEEIGFDAQTGLCSGFKVKDYLGIGLSINYLYLLDMIYAQERKGWGITGDFGLLYKPLASLALALVVKNLGKDIRYIETEIVAKLPRLIRIGTGWKIIEKKDLKIFLCGELTKLFEEKDLWKSVGFEISGFDFLSLRIGYYEDKSRERQGFTYGLGVLIKKVNFELGTDEKIYDYPRSDWRLSVTYRP